MAVTDATPPPSRWTPRAIRATLGIVRDLTLSGVRRAPERRSGIALRSGMVQHYSPDPEYVTKYAHLIRCLNEAAREPGRVALVFLDEMGYARRPDAGPDWADGRRGAAPPVADRAGGPNRLWRIIGALNAVTGRVDFRDAYIVGRAKVIRSYKQLDAAYPDVERLLVVEAHWAIHTHADVVGAPGRWPRIEPVWLPTYAPWLNPIEKRWRWLRQDVLKLHRLAADWPSLRGRVDQFLGQFAAGSQDLLRYVGLTGNGKLAQALRVQPYLPISRANNH
jgi:putative transposase